MDEHDPRFSNVDLGSLLEDLFDYAKSLFDPSKCGGDDPSLTGAGKSPKDLVHEALTEFIIKKTDWCPPAESAQAQLFYYVRTMIKNDFLDLVRDGRAHKRTDIIGATQRHRGDGDSSDELPSEDVSFRNLTQDLNDDEIIRRAYKAVEGEPELAEYLDAVFRDGHTKRSKVASEIGIGIPEASRRRDRLKTRLTPLKRALEAGIAAKSHRA
jgi:hypothetical protein